MGMENLQQEALKGLCLSPSSITDKRKDVEEALKKHAEKNGSTLKELEEMQRKALFEIDTYSAVLEENVRDAIKTGRKLETEDVVVENGQATAKNLVGLKAAWLAYKDARKGNEVYKNLVKTNKELRKNLFESDYVQFQLDLFNDERREERTKEQEEAVAKMRGVLAEMDKEVKPPVYAPSAGKYQNVIISLNKIEKFADKGYAEPTEKAIGDFIKVIDDEMDLERFWLFATDNIQHSEDEKDYLFIEDKGPAKEEEPVDKHQKWLKEAERLRERAGPEIHELLRSVPYTNIGRNMHGEIVCLNGVEQHEELTEAYDIFTRPDGTITVSLSTASVFGTKNERYTTRDGVPVRTMEWAGCKKDQMGLIGYGSMTEAARRWKGRLSVDTDDIGELERITGLRIAGMERKRTIYESDLQEELGAKTSRQEYVASMKSSIGGLEREMEELKALQENVHRCEGVLAKNLGNISGHMEYMAGTRGKTVLRANENHTEVVDFDSTIKFLKLLEEAVMAEEMDLPNRRMNSTAKGVNNAIRDYWVPNVTGPIERSKFKESLSDIGKAVLWNFGRPILGYMTPFSPYMPSCGYGDNLTNAWSWKKKLALAGVSLGALGVGYVFGVGDYISNLLNQPPKADFDLRTDTRTLFFIAPTGFTAWDTNGGDTIKWVNKCFDEKTPVDKLKYNWYVQYNSTGDWFPINYTGDTLGRFHASNDVGHNFKLIAIDEGGKQDSKILTMPFDPARLQQYQKRSLGIPIGISYLVGRQFLYPSPFRGENEVREHMDVIIKDLGYRAIKIYGDNENWLLKCAEIAIEKGFYTIALAPLYRMINQTSEIDVNQYVRKVADFSIKTEELRKISNSIKLIMASELSLEAAGIRSGMTYKDRQNELPTQWRSEKINNRLNSVLKEMISEVRKNFHGEVTYGKLGGGDGGGGLENVNWGNLELDTVGSQEYWPKRLFTKEQMLKAIKDLKYYNKPVWITEFGSCTYEGASLFGGAGGDHYEGKKYDEKEQAESITDQINLFKEANVDLVFLHTFTAGYWDKNEFFYGIVRGQKDGFTRRKSGFYAAQNS